MSRVLVAALVDVGCPKSRACEIARELRVERRHGEWLALLVGHGSGVDVPVERGGWAAAVAHLAENLAADDAEAVNRSARGEAGWVPLWS